MRSRAEQPTELSEIREVASRATPPVAFVSEHARPGGAQRRLELLLSEIDRSSIRGIILLEAGPHADRLRSRGYTVHIIPAKGWRAFPGAALKVRRVLRGWDHRVIHANGIKAALVTTMATVGTRTPVVWSKFDHWWDGWLARLVGARSRIIMCNSRDTARTFGRRLARKVRIVPAGIPGFQGDRKRERERLRSMLGARAGHPLLVLAGRLDPAKGYEDVLEIMPEILTRSPHARVAIFGATDPAHPDYETHLRRRIAELNLDDAVALLGFREDAAALFGGCDLVVVPSIVEEGFGLVGVESLAAGTPVVAYSSGAIPEVLGDCALLVPPRDRSALREAIVRVLTDDALRARLVECGRELAERYSVGAMVSSTLECYREAAGRVGR
jgi:glycosyltransferase involved in cell wall biosynthesis